MNTFYFSLIFLAAGTLFTGFVWIFTAPHWRRLTMWRPVPLLFSLSNAMHLLSGFFFPLPLELDVPIRSIGLTIFLVGVFVACWAKFAMGKSWGMPAQHDTQTQKELVTHGPFRYSRNPIYVGMILMNFGTAIALKSAFILLIFVIYNFMYTQILIEEQLLKKIFGKKYSDYLRAVPRFV